ncbi:lytic transglycosylase domain-containing protein [Erythrobacter sp. THAF29]|uniref:lytic transglycosylase domain-containing protein n=1 Tax=Erythrobacter sp. THAF29 TaxID=2587851 RepID=UPI0012A9852D|nr:lytic transglycosylase domain-containing protein [Erythrobacter sp. THAF29]QFT78206.1 Soluble lytic murein transglycosylase precursor [Erythrobacter sp. THAF29]
MSSMLRQLRKSPVLLAAIAATGFTASPASAMAEAQGDARGSSMLARQPSSIGGALAQWERLQADRELGFSDYAGFVLRYPDFPRTELLRIRAENTLENETPSQAEVLHFFDAYPPLTNRGRALYALSLAGAGRDGAAEMARQAWRGGTMSGPAEVYLLSLYGNQFTKEDHAARMNALLWQQNAEAAERHMINLAPQDRPMAMARLALLRGSTPSEAGLTIPPNAMRDAGYIFNLVNHYRAKRETNNAIRLLATRPSVEAPAFDPEEMLGDILAVAKAANAADTVRIVSRIDDLFEPGTDISQGSFRLRDRYTDLMWMGGTNALWRQSDGARAASMFERYGKAARSPLTRAKGFYWAGRASRQAGNEDQARRYFEMAAEYPHYYYGQLALNAMGKPMPEFAQLPRLEIDAATRAEFEARPIVQAIRHMAQNRHDWRTERRFFQAIGEQAKTPQELMLVYELATTTGLDEMAVVVGMEASANGLKGFERIGFPIVDVPRVNDWTMVHAIARQESEFDRTRRSHANAIGMMQLLRSTAREEAGILGIQYLSANLTEDPKYNITLGDAHFARRMDLYGGAYPLAIASYNAGPGRVREWIRLNGDPRRGDIDWVTWIEKIPANFETRYYVMRVIGNAVTYSHMYPEKAGIPRTVDRFLP